MMEYVFDKMENIMEKGESAGHQHFLLCPHCFQKPFSLEHFSSAVLGENQRYCDSRGVIVVVIVVVVQKLRFCYISVICEDIYLKLGICVQYPKSNPYYQGRQFKMQFFFFRIMLFFF